MKTDKNIINSIRARYLAVPICLLLFAIAVIWKVVYIQNFETSLLKEEESSQQKKIIHPRRGDILDKNGKVLACSVPEYVISFDARIAYFQKYPNLIDEKIDSLADGLAKIFPEEGDKHFFYAKIKKAKNEKKLVKLCNKNIDYNQLQKVKKLPLLRMGAYKGGLNIVVENNRVYPYGGMARRTIGFLRKGEYHGTTGIEKAYDEALYGSLQNINSDSLSFWGYQSEETGLDIVTTIDADIQTITHEELTATLKDYCAEWGCAVVMDVKTGEIRAISNLSHYDNPLDSNFYENLNYAVSELREPGSTIKLPSLMVALEDNCIKLNDTINTGDGVITYQNGQLTVTDWNHKTHGGFHKISVCDVFANSSNIGVSKIINDHYVTGKREWDYIDRIKAMGLDRKSGIDLIGEPSPIIKDPSMKTWSGISLLQMSYGYEIELTPLQILTFYNAIANDGKMMRPHLVREIKNDSRTIKKMKPQTINRSICSRETLAKTHTMLESVIERGTAKRYASKYYKIAGKTGTAQTFEKGRYNKSKLRGSFCGYFPADDPKYSCIVVIQSNDNINYGAVGVFKNIADRIFFTDTTMHRNIAIDTASNENAPTVANGFASDFEKLYTELNISHENTMGSEWIKTKIDNNKIIKAGDLFFAQGVMPNFYGMGMRDVLFLADSLNIDVKTMGSGKLYRQSIHAGTPYRQNDVVVLEFR